MKPYDDPYKILANTIVIDYSTAEVKRILSDKHFTRKIIEKELRRIDFYGSFLDCIVTDIYEKDKWVFLDMLNDLSYKLYAQLDMDRLIVEVEETCHEFGIDID